MVYIARKQMIVLDCSQLWINVVVHATSLNLTFPSSSSNVFDELVLTKGILRETERRVEQLEASLEAALDETEDLKKKNENISLKIASK